MAKTPRPIGPLTLAVAEELRVLVARRKVSARQLGDGVGASNSTVSRILRGEGSIDVEMLEQLASLLGDTGSAVMARAEASVLRDLTAGRLDASRFGLAALAGVEGIEADDLPNEP